MIKRNYKLVAFDLDGCLTKETCWTPEECLNAKPDFDNIAKLNKISRQCSVFIYTARTDELIPSTLKWLRRWDMGRYPISNHKVAATVYVDDRALNIKDL